MPEHEEIARFVRPIAETLRLMRQIEARHLQEDPDAPRFRDTG